MIKKQKHTLLLGEGIHQHTLVGDFQIDEKPSFTNLVVDKPSQLKHEKPDGTFGEHETLPIEAGNWSMGKQVEYNPFDNNITEIWD